MRKWSQELCTFYWIFERTNIFRSAGFEKCPSYLRLVGVLILMIDLRSVWLVETLWRERYCYFYDKFWPSISDMIAIFICFMLGWIICIDYKTLVKLLRSLYFSQFYLQLISSLCIIGSLMCCFLWKFLSLDILVAFFRVQAEVIG